MTDENHKPLRKYNKGFTLIELVLIIAIIGILSTLAVLNYGKIRDKVSKIVCDINFSIINREYTAFLAKADIDMSLGDS